MGIINRVKKFFGKCLTHAERVVDEMSTDSPIDSEAGADTKLIIRGKDFGPIYWVETNYLAKSHIIHCKNGDYEL